MKVFSRQAIGIKIETVAQGTAVVPSSATDYILVEDVELDTNPEILERDYRRASLDNVSHVVGGRFCKVKFKVEMKGSGTRGDATPAGFVGLDAALQACGMTSTVSAGTSITYNPTSVATGFYYGPGKSVTIEVYKDGLKHIIAGCLGDVKLSIEAGKFGNYEFDFMGLYADPTDVAVPTPTIVNVQPPIFMGSTISVQGFAAILSKVEVSLGNKISTRVDAASPTSIKGFVITDRNPKGSVQIEAESVASHNFFNKLMTSAEASSSFSVGATAGNIITVTMPKTQYSDIKYQQRDKFLDFQIPLAINMNSGDDSIAIVVT